MNTYASLGAEVSVDEEAFLYLFIKVCFIRLLINRKFNVATLFEKFMQWIEGL